MLEQLASEVGELGTQRPLRPFKPARLRVASIGNCVLNKLNAILIRQPGVDALFTSNLKTWSNHHRETFFERAEEADIVLAMKSRRGQLYFSTEELISMFGAKIVFVPIIRIEGLDTLQRYGDLGAVRFSGGDPIAASIKEHGVDHTYEALVRGRLRTDPQGRLARSLAELRTVEEGAVAISDFVEERILDIPLINSISHPAGEVVLELFARLCHKIDIPIDRERLNSPLMISQASLPMSPRVLSPFDVEDLGLKYEADPDWMLQAKSLLANLQSMLRNGNYVFGEEGTDIA